MSIMTKVFADIEQTNSHVNLSAVDGYEIAAAATAAAEAEAEYHEQCFYAEYAEDAMTRLQGVIGVMEAAGDMTPREAHLVGRCAGEAEHHHFTNRGQVASLESADSETVSVAAVEGAWDTIKSWFSKAVEFVKNLVKKLLKFLGLDFNSEEKRLGAALAKVTKAKEETPGQKLDVSALFDKDDKMTKQEQSIGTYDFSTLQAGDVNGAEAAVGDLIGLAGDAAEYFRGLPEKKADKEALEGDAKKEFEKKIDVVKAYEEVFSKLANGYEKLEISDLSSHIKKTAFGGDISDLKVYGTKVAESVAWIAMGKVDDKSDKFIEKRVKIAAGTWDDKDKDDKEDGKVVIKAIFGAENPTRGSIVEKAEKHIDAMTKALADFRKVEGNLGKVSKKVESLAKTAEKAFGDLDDIEDGAFRSAASKAVRSLYAGAVDASKVSTAIAAKQWSLMKKQGHSKLSMLLTAMDAKKFSEDGSSSKDEKPAAPKKGDKK